MTRSPGMGIAPRLAPATRRLQNETGDTTMANKYGPNKYGPKAGEEVEKAMREMKRGKLKSGSGDKVANPKQAVAIGLSKARKAGGKVPAKKK
jgi:hypothetical protein